MAAAGTRLTDLKSTSENRSLALAHVHAALPGELAATVVTAGIVEGRLTLGVAGAAWAARLRYVTDTLRMRVSGSMKVEIISVRIKVVPPTTDRPTPAAKKPPTTR